MSHHKQQEHHVRPYKILAQSIGFLVCILLVLFVTGEGVPKVINASREAFIFFVPLFCLCILGFILTWFREALGASVMATGGSVFLIYFIFLGDLKMAVTFGIPFIIAGGLFMLHNRKKNELINKKV